ncbi:MAG TPA: hypothetical protein VGK99_10595 [Acidobacteriota bacterium]|jgi:hypothetical protein
MMQHVLNAVFVLLAFLSSLSLLHAETYYVNFQVRDPAGLYIPKLSLEDLRLSVDGVEKQPAYLFGRDLPMAIAVFYDNGPSMAPEVFTMNPYYQTPLQRSSTMTLEILDNLKADYAMALYSYFQEPVRLTDFTSDAEMLERGLRNLRGMDKHVEVEVPLARLSIALDRGIEMLKKRDEKRKALLFFSYVMDQDTSHMLDSLPRRLARHNIELYVISFGPRSATGPGFTQQERMSAYWFRKLTDGETANFYLADMYREDLRQLSFEIASRWNTTFTLAFESNEPLGGKPFKIELAKPQMKVLARRTLP